MASLTFVAPGNRAAVIGFLHATTMADIQLDPAASTMIRDAQLAALLRSAASGNARAFEEFYTGTVHYALAVVRRIVGASHAQDVLADCYFQIWRESSRFDAERGSAVTWLLTIARSRALDRLRQEALRHGGMSGAPAHNPDDTRPHEDPGPDALLESVERKSRLHAALVALSPHERWVLGLAYFKEHTQSEIAELTGFPLGTVKSLMTRAQQKLRVALDAASFRQLT
ncbi:MAG: sigma-70 family RNA polymerase sigma factor [Pseudomonadota bacterium]